MIVCISGVPGSGKTLHALSYVLEHYPDRNVYYYHIDGLTLPWTEMDDPRLWYELPPASVIVIDEAHKYFEKTDGKSTPPPHIAKLDEHRHHGFDIVLITQAPQDLNTYVRNRIAPFIILERPIHNPEKCNVFTWARYQTHPDIPDVRDKADFYEFKYPKELYDKYKSATLHTVKREVPKGIKRLAMIGVACVFLLAAAGYFFYSKTMSLKDNTVENVVEQEKPKTLRDDYTVDIDRLDQGAMSYQQYINIRKPRVQGVPASAPMYDELTKPNTAPKLHCIANKEKCWCYTQQVTRVNTDESTCRRIVEYGYFDSTKVKVNSL